MAPATVRQVFYQAVIWAFVQDEARSYRAVQRQLLKLREEGAVPYGLITDNDRIVRTRARWDSPEHFAREAAARYHRDYWAESDARVEVWLEKDAWPAYFRPPWWTSAGWSST